MLIYFRLHCIVLVTPKDGQVVAHAHLRRGYEEFINNPKNLKS